ncbi:N terminus of Rad21 [Tritrichomonas foetus]|uniref:N terminus of Rad21 n=1 Tax=Tritrichomonas foetus TaxID=1144522 RepID=A0A1J4JH87_9EUKA|nr:N terminus of Rad21 [Tritrichomonas foetus]|eukprot:OHS98494.1 N terminus of Rad21 [Tritrichomonas foetus]
MLGDCEDIINKIMQSFKTGSSVNLPDVVKNLPKEIGSITIESDRDGNNSHPTTFNLDEWANVHDPESEFIVQAAPLEFPSSENSQLSTQVDDFTSSTANSQILMSSEADLGESFVPNPARNFHEDDAQALPDWVDLPDNDDDVPIPDYQNDFDNSDNENENDEEDNKRNRGRIVDKGTTKLNDQPKLRKRARPVASKRSNVLPQNDELEDLFNLAKEQFANTPNQANNNNNNGDDENEYEAFGFGGFDDDDNEVNRSNEIQNDDQNNSAESSTSEDDSNDESLSSKSDVEVQKISSTMISPYPNVQFAVETTPRRTVESSVTQETIRTLGKLKRAMEGKKSVSFSEAFAGSSRRAAASAFLQVLVLKSAVGAINLHQNDPLGEIEIFQGENFSAH